MGTYEIKIGEEKKVSVEDRPNITINSTLPQIIGNSIKIISIGQKSCTVQGIQEGTSILKWSGIVDGTPYEMEWTFDVIPGVAPNKYFYENNEDGIRLFYVGWDYGGFTYPVLSSTPESQGGICHISDAEVASANGKLVIPEKAHGVTVFKIGKNSIRSLSNLTDLVLPSNLSFIDHFGIGYSPNLKTITCKAPNPPKKYYADGKMFDKSVLNATLYVPKGSVEKYRAADEWKDFKSIQEIEDPGKEIQINATNFPDKNFRDYLLSLDEGKDGKFSERELINIYALNVNGRNIKSLKGIEFFGALGLLDCNNNQLTSIDVSKNSALSELRCAGNQLTSLDLSRNPALTSFECYSNLLTSLDVSRNTALTSLSCENNYLTSLNVSKNTYLTSLKCSNNQLKTLDISGSSALSVLLCDNNLLPELDVSNNTALTYLYCYSNKITSLDVSKNIALTYFRCNYNLLTTLDVSNNISLATLNCQSNNLKELDVSKNGELSSLACGVNQLTFLDISQNTKLLKLWCHSNLLKKLDISKNKSLQFLNISQSQIRGSSMDDIINYLPMNKSTSDYRICVYNSNKDETFYRDEGNVCTKEQVAAIKAKGWTPLCYNGSEWVEYEGSDEVPDIQLISVKSNNKDLTNLSPNDNLVLEGIFKNTGATSVIDTRLRIWNQDMEAVAYSSSLSNEFKTNVQTTVKHEYALTNIPEGTYYATIQYFEEWDRQKWVYYKNLLISFNVKKLSDGYKDGDFFVAKTQEGVDMSFQIISTTDKTCQVIGNEKCGNTYNGNDAYPAINNNYSGSITIPDHANGYKVVKLGDTSFSACDVKSIFIPDGILYIGEEAFSWSENLSSLIIPNSIVSIGSEIIEGCSKLESIISYIQEPHDIDWKVFWSNWEVFTPATLYVPKGTKSTYLSKKGWGLFNNNIVEFDPSTFDPTTLGIHDVMMDDDKNAPIYDLFGRKLSQPNKGINIIGRKKVVVK